MLHLIEGADPITFEVLGLCAQVEKARSYYAKDKNYVYAGGEVVQGADPNTFEILGEFDANPGGLSTSSTYAKDMNAVYEGCGSKIEGADSATFVYKGGRNAQDVHHLYRDGIIVGKTVDQAVSVANKRVSFTLPKKSEIFVQEFNPDMRGIITTGCLQLTQEGCNWTSGECIFAAELTGGMCLNVKVEEAEGFIEGVGEFRKEFANGEWYGYEWSVDGRETRFPIDFSSYYEPDYYGSELKAVTTGYTDMGRIWGGFHIPVGGDMVTLSLDGTDPDTFESTKATIFGSVEIE